MLSLLPKKMYICTVSLVCILIASVASGQNPVVKVDFNQSGRQLAEVNEPGYTPWVVKSQLADTLKIDSITVILTKVGDSGTHLQTDWYKAGIQSPNYARLVDDGVTVTGGNGGGQIEMRIKGLPTGIHTLLTYHNTVQSPTVGPFSPINISVNGVLSVKDLLPTNRALKTSDAKSAYLILNAQADSDVVILFAADTTGTDKVKNVIINGFELNTSNIVEQANTIFPLDRDEHVETPTGSIQMIWSKGKDATSHHLYIGNDSTSVSNADSTSSLYIGNKILTDTTYQISNLKSLLTYYWRVDEVTPDGTVKGNTWKFRRAQLAFPDAEGHGKYARGGRGGVVVEVTNLNDSGPGSLRAAVTNAIGPRTIVFTVSGMIQLQSRLVLSSNYVTVAGQTAPGKGICIRSAPFGAEGNDVVVRFMRVRVGGGTTYDGMGLTGANYSILDHCSISWTIDEAFSSRSAKNITLQRTLISEALNVAGHQNYPPGTAHGYAATIGGDIGTFHHNLLAHCEGRNWSLGGGLDANGFYAGRLDIINNVVYNWETRTTDGGAKEVNFVNNYYKPGAASKIFVALSMQHEGTGKGMQRTYFAGNVMPSHFNEATETTGRRSVYSNGDTSSYQTFVLAPFFPSDVTTQTATNGYKMVLSNVGANMPVFDDHDIRMVTETLNGTYSLVGSVSGIPGLPDNQADAGGYENYPALTRATNWDSDHDGLPDWWENLKGLNTNSPAGEFSDANADPDGDGYTNLDDYLEWMATPHFSSPDNAAIAINLKTLARGFNLKPSFKLTNIINGQATVDTAGIATFTPPVGGGLSSFEFTVTDTQGDTMTRKINVVSGVADSIFTALPVKLVAFNATRKNKEQVVLNWQTAQETNNAQFEIQRKAGTDNTFKTVGAVSSKAIGGNSSQQLNYSFIDANSTTADTYYRLLQTDKEGKISYSEIKLVKGVAAINAGIKIWPSPNNGHFSVLVSGMKQSIGQLKIFDITGKCIWSQAVENDKAIHVDVKSQGMHVVKVYNADGTSVQEGGNVLILQ